MATILNLCFFQMLRNRLLERHHVDYSPADLLDILGDFIVSEAVAAYEKAVVR